MTIGEAIKVLRGLQCGTIWPTPQREKNAIKLGIEALHRVVDLRTKPSYTAEAPLPGETKDIKRGMTETIFINPERD